jgi:archaellum biogenesis ATPase FlaH
MTPRLDIAEVYKWWDVLRGGGQLTEIRMISNDGKTASGIFDNIDTLINAITPFTNDWNIYYTMNRLPDDARGLPQYNKVIVRPKQTCNDNTMVARDWVCIDLDSVRLSGTNATDEQLQHTYKKTNEIYKYLLSIGINRPCVLSSGNGTHTYMKCAMLNNEKNTKLVKRFLHALAMMFTDEHTDVDVSIHNCARIMRLPGSYSCKGNTLDPTRPQRPCKFVKIPSDIKVNDIEYFEKVADLYPEEEVRPSAENNYSTDKFDLESFITKHNIEIAKVQKVAGGTKYLLKECFWNPDHKSPDSMLFQRDNGAISFFCYHASCSQYKWQDVRRKFEPNAYEKSYSNRYNVRPTYNREIQKEFVQQEKTEEKGDVWLKLGSVTKAKMDEKDFIKTGIYELDKYGLGLMRKHLTVLTGLRASGKTSLLNMLILNQVQQGYNVGLWSGEMTAGEVKQWMFLQAAGKNHVVKRGESEYYETPPHIDEKIGEWLDKYFSLYSNNYSADIQQLVSEIKDRHKQEFFDIIYIDNLMVLGDDSLSGSTIERNKKTLIILSELCKELNVHVVLIAHPNKNSGLLRLANISGTADISNLAQNVLLWHRVKYNEEEYIHDFERDYEEFFGKGSFQRVKDYSNVLEVAKFRAKGSLMGRVFGMYYEKETGRFKNTIAEHIVYGWLDEPNVYEQPNDEVQQTMPFNPFEGSEVPF